MWLVLGLVGSEQEVRPVWGGHSSARETSLAVGLACGEFKGWLRICQWRRWEACQVGIQSGQRHRDKGRAEVRSSQRCSAGSAAEPLEASRATAPRGKRVQSMLVGFRECPLDPGRGPVRVAAVMTWMEEEQQGWVDRRENGRCRRRAEQSHRAFCHAGMEGGSAGSPRSFWKAGISFALCNS